MRILADVVPHAKQAYSTSGDYHFTRSDTLYVQVSALGDWRMEMLIAVHEIVEALLTRNAGIDDGVITAFDREFEAARLNDPAGEHAFLFRGRTIAIDAEPGDDRDAPYHRQHCFATAVERMMCAELGLRWDDYERAERQLYEESVP